LPTLNRSLKQPWRNLLVTVAISCLIFALPSIYADDSSDGTAPDLADTAAGNASEQANVTLSSDTELSTAGYFRLNWSIDHSELQNSAAEKPDFELQQATQPDFADAFTLYQGPDQATVISGLANNIYYYRVRVADNPTWSDKLRVEVKHHSLTRAFGFFGLGIVMFIVTVIVLLKGTRLTSASSDTRHGNA